MTWSILKGLTMTPNAEVSCILIVLRVAGPTINRGGANADLTAHHSCPPTIVTRLIWTSCLCIFCWHVLSDFDIFHADIYFWINEIGRWILDVTICIYLWMQKDIVDDEVYLESKYLVVDANTNFWMKYVSAMIYLWRGRFIGDAKMYSWMQRISAGDAFVPIDEEMHLSKDLGMQLS